MLAHLIIVVSCPMQDFVPGQRWVVDAEPELGLGIVVEVDARAITLVFPQSETERMYARAKAPLTRITFLPGDEVHLRDGSRAEVIAVHDQNGVMVYDIGQEQLVPETALAAEVKSNQPFLRLMTGQLDKPQFFAFRRKLDDAIARVWQARLTGLLGVRASLIEHQLYVAWSACERERVRVLLADEVGLGKTLEAGMILSRLIRSERVNRAVVLVPDALVVQWLVELIRRFQLYPDIYTGEDHPFDEGSILLAPHSLLEHDQLPEGLFARDICIVDEAHRLTPGSQAFDHLSELAQMPHCVLLTATPEQLGVESHFARLNLLDPAKFGAFEDFMAQERTFVDLNRKIQALPAGREALLNDYGLPFDASDDLLLQHLLDCHGVGRVMFRNTRASVKGFPSRVAKPHWLDDASLDAKINWLAGFLKSQPKQKVLVIAHLLEDVQTVEATLWRTHGIDVAVFHEGMDLVERDRAAAYFADNEQGAQVLICSEMGSEGRNFQFSHHLVCLDLPEHPDLLEQRIGRLDRIGQTEAVTVHVPMGEGSEDADRYHWYHEVLQCIDRQNPAAGAVHDEFWEDRVGAESKADIDQAAGVKVQALEQDILQGRDALLELNSCRRPDAEELKAKIESFEQDTPLALVEAAAEILNFHFEETRADVYSLMPADNMLIPALPNIPAEGVEVTFLRAVANAREDVMYISWDAPFIVGLWELLHHSDIGSASVALLPSKQLSAGQCLLEACFDILIQAPNRAQCLPFLPALSIRTLVLDISDKDLSQALPEAALEASMTRVDKKLARKIIASRKEQMPLWYQRAEGFAETQRHTLIQQALAAADEHFQRERARMSTLAKRNAAVSQEEVAAVQAVHSEVQSSLTSRVVVQLSAARLIVTTAP